VTKILVLLASAGLNAQDAGRLEIVFGVAPTYEVAPATDVLLNSPKRVLSGGPNAFYFSEPGGRLIKVHADGVLSVFGNAALESPGAADTDAAGNYYYSLGTGIAKISSDGLSSVPYSFFNDPAFRIFNRPTAIASNCNGGDSLYVSNAVGILALPAGPALTERSAAHASRMFWCPPVGLRWIDSSRLRVYGDFGLLAGSGSSGIPLDDQAAVEASFQSLMDLAVDREGGVYIADGSAGSVYRIKDGIVHRFAGSPDGPVARAGVDAKDARFLSIDSIALDSSGRLLIVDSDAFTVWRVNEDGTLSRAAGRARGESESNGSVALSDPAGLTYDRSGNLYVVDRLNFRIRVLRADGSVETIAGNGLPGGEPEDGLALDVSIRPSGPIIRAETEWFYFIDQSGMAIRRFQAGGAIETFLRVSDLGELGEARFMHLGITRTGELLVSQSNRVLAVTGDKQISVRAETNSSRDVLQFPAVFAVLEDESIVVPGQSSLRWGFFRFVPGKTTDFVPFFNDGASVPFAGPFTGIAATSHGFVTAKPGALCGFTLNGRGRVLAGAISRQTEPVVGALGMINAVAAQPDGSLAFAGKDTNLVRTFVPVMSVTAAGRATSN
jgi:hypothetical protein